MALADLLARLERRTDTSVTRRNPDEVAAKPSPIQACTLVTPDTPQNGIGRATDCASCAHTRKPGGVTLYCCFRPDLPPAYGDGHPLRQLPDDGGGNCGRWVDARSDKNVHRCPQNKRRTP